MQEQNNITIYSHDYNRIEHSVVDFIAKGYRLKNCYASKKYVFFGKFVYFVELEKIPDFIIDLIDKQCLN